MPSGDGERDVISIHALRKESDPPTISLAPRISLFQSTLSVRRATIGTGHARTVSQISIHALRKESDEQGQNVQQLASISIHALRKESDEWYRLQCWRRIISIHALRKESDFTNFALKTNEQISIHALRKESDGCVPPTSTSSANFNPRSP